MYNYWNSLIQQYFMFAIRDWHREFSSWITDTLNQREISQTVNERFQCAHAICLTFWRNRDKLIVE